jgi:hypothetical protein
MQKMSIYMYPNRIEVVADLDNYATEFYNVYHRNIKIYNGVDNKIEFDVKNSDQKRLDLSKFSQMQLHVMDSQGTALPNSPYSITPTALKGIGMTIIPELDLDEIESQYLKYSVTATSNGNDIIMYTDTKFNAKGTIELVGDALPTYRDPIVYNSFTSTVDLKGNPVFHSSAIPVRFYEAVPTTEVSLDIQVTGFAGSIWIDAATTDTISVESFKAAGKPFGSWNQLSTDGLYSGIIPFGKNLNIENYSYFRVSYSCPSSNGLGASFDVTKDNNQYTVLVTHNGTGYSANSFIKVPGAQLGGETGVNDLLIKVESVESLGSGMSSSYGMSSINNISWTGTANDGHGFYKVTGTNYSGMVNSITLL